MFVSGLTCAAADRVHGSDAPPLVSLGVVAFGGAQPVRAVEASHRVQQPVDHGHTDSDPPRQHRRHQLPAVPLRIIPEHEHSHQETERLNTNTALTLRQTR